jgi:hypothetical protein
MQQLRGAIYTSYTRRLAMICNVQKVKCEILYLSGPTTTFSTLLGPVMYVRALALASGGARDQLAFPIFKSLQLSSSLLSSLALDSCI